MANCSTFMSANCIYWASERQVEPVGLVPSPCTRRVAVACCIWLLPAGAVTAQPPPQPPPPSDLPVIVAIGEAIVRRAPDRAFITVSVETRAKSPRDAQRLNAEAMTAVHQRLTGARMPSDAIRTAGYDLQQEFDFVHGRRVPREYLARNTLEVRVDEVSRAGEIMDIVVQGGATSLTGVRFDLQDRTSAEREALRLAVADARARADAAAAGAGRSVDRVIRIDDSREGGFPPPRPMVAMARTAEAVQTPVDPGLIEIHSRVSLTVSMK
jgi:uncharacterized protein YggE